MLELLLDYFLEGEWAESHRRQQELVLRRPVSLDEIKLSWHPTLTRDIELRVNYLKRRHTYQ